MCTCGCTRDELYDDGDSVFFKTCVAAARDRTTAIRLRQRAALGDALLGEGTGNRHWVHAQRLELTARTGFARARRMLRAVEDSDDVAEAVANGGMSELIEVARTTALGMLIDSGCSPAEAHRGIEHFTQSADRVQQLTSPTAVFEYLDERLAQLTTAEVRAAADEPTAFCILILLFSSLYYLILIAALFTGNAAYWFPIMVNQVCRDLAS